MMRFGAVVQVDADACRVRVKFDAHDDLVSAWLPVMQFKTLRDQVYWLPDLNEQVVVLLDENAEQGVVLGAVYSTPHPPPASDPDLWLMRFEDGTQISYHRKDHLLDIRVQGDVKLTATGEIQFAGALFKWKDG